MDHCQEACVGFVVSGGDAAEFLDFAEEVFHQMTPLVHLASADRTIPVESKDSVNELNPDVISAPVTPNILVVQPGSLEWPSKIPR
jgi:hypothetical protein